VKKNWRLAIADLPMGKRGSDDLWQSISNWQSPIGNFSVHILYLRVLLPLFSVDITLTSE